MTSNDNQQYITVELFNSKMETLMTQIRLENEKLRSELHGEIQAVHSDVKVNSAQIAELHHFMYWGFAILTLVSALVPLFRHERKEKRQEQNQTILTEDKVQAMIAKALSEFRLAGK